MSRNCSLVSDGESPIVDDVDRHVDVINLSALVDEGNNEIKSLRGKHVVLVIGKTGVGKSSFIQLLNGAKAVRVANGYQILEDDSNYLPDFKIGYQLSSQTKCIRSYKKIESKLTYCDMPGFKDSHSYNVDIATAVWIKSIAKASKSLRFVVMVNGATLEDDKGEPFRDLMEMFSKLVSNDPQKIMHSITFLFTHMSDQFEIERNESDVLKYLDKKIHDILVMTSNKHAKKMMLILRTLLLKFPGHVRVINPVTTDFQELSMHMKLGVKPISQAENIVQPSVPREIELAVSLALGKLESAIKESLFSTFVEVQKTLPELLRCFAYLAKLLNSPKHVDTLKNLMLDVVEEYDKNKQCVMSVLNSDVSNKTHDMPIGREEVLLVIPKISKLKFIGECLRVYCVEEGSFGLSEATESQGTTDDFFNLQVQFHRKRLLLKMFVLGQINTALDYITVFIALENLSVLSLLEDAIGGKYNTNCACFNFFNVFILFFHVGECDSLPLNLPDTPQQFCDIMRNCFRSAPTIKVLCADFTRTISEIVAPSLQYLFSRCLDVCVVENTEFSFPNPSSTSCDEFLAYTGHLEKYLDQQMSDIICPYVVNLSLQDLYTLIVEHIRGLHSAVENVVSGSSLRGFEEENVLEFYHNIRRIQSFDMCDTGDTKSNSELEKCAHYFHRQDQHFCDFVKHHFNGISDQLGQTDDGNLFNGLLSRIELFRKFDCLEILFPLSVMELQTLMARLENKAYDLVSQLGPEFETAMKSKSFVEVKCQLERLILAKTQIELLLPTCDVLKKAYWEMVNSLRKEKNVYVEDVVKRTRGTQFSTLSIASCIDVDVEDGHFPAEMYEQFVASDVIDKFGFYNPSWNGQLEISKESVLFAKKSKIGDFIRAAIQEETNHVLVLDTSLRQYLKWLKSLSWFDEIATDERMSVDDVLSIAKDGCCWRLNTLHKNIMTNTDLTSCLCHDHLVRQLAELDGLSGLSESCLALGTDSVLLTKNCVDKIVSMVNAKVNSFVSVCEQVKSISSLTSSFPFKEVNDLLVSKGNYVDVVQGMGLSAIFQEMFALVEDAIIRTLKNLVESPLKQHPSDYDLLAKIFIFQDKLKHFDHLRTLVPILDNYSGDGLSLIQATGNDVEKLKSEIQQLLSTATDFVLLEQKIAQLENYKVVDEWVDSRIADSHNFFFGQYLTLHSSVQEDMKKKILEWNFSGFREYLFKCNNPDNRSVFKRYEELMTLIAAQLKQCISHYRGNVKDGNIMSECFQNLDHVWTEIGGSDSSTIDYVHDFCKINLNTELKEIRQLVRDYIDNTVVSLKNFRRHFLENAVQSADVLLTYNNKIKDNTLQGVLDLFIDKELVQYLSWNGSSEPVEHSLAAELLMLVHSVNLRQTSNDVSIAVLTNLLDQLQHLKDCVQCKRISDWIDYDFWCRQIVKHFTEMFDDIATSAVETGAFATCLSILKYASTQFSEGFLKHMKGDVFRLKARIESMATQLEEYNRAKETWYESKRSCLQEKKILDALRKEDDKKNYYSFGYNVKFPKYVSQLSRKKATSEYKKEIQYIERCVKRLLNDFSHALEDQNYELVEKHLTSLNFIDEVLYEHISVPFLNVDRFILEKFKENLQELRSATTDMRTLDSRFAEFFRFRQMLEKTGLMPDKASLESLVELHNEITENIVACRKAFDDMCSKFDFGNALTIFDKLKGCLQFINAASTKDYCKKFGVSSYLKTASGVKASRYSRVSERFIDHGAEKLKQTLDSFPQAPDITNKIMQLHNTLIELVKDSAGNHEYFKLKSISTGLLSFHLLDEFGGGKDRIDGTKNTIQGIIKGSLDALRQDVTKFWGEKDWSNLNNSIKLLQDAEEELKHFSGFIDTSLLYNIQQELESKLYDIASQAITIATGNCGDLNERIRDFAIKLADLGRVYDQVQVFHVIAKIQINRVLNHCREQLSFSFIFKLGVILEEGSVFDNVSDPESSVRIGKRLISDFSHFKDVATMSWNKNVAQIPAEDSMKNMRAYTYDSSSKTKTDYIVDKQILLDMYAEYKTKYDELIVKYLPNNQDEVEIVELVRQRVQGMMPCDLLSWDDNKKKEIPLILAGIFSYFTVTKCGASFNSIGESDDADAAVTAQQILITPHNIQVLTILRLLGCGDSSTSMQNQLMQIGTGEGKSIVLGALATIFGLFNCPVRCVCYSEYLSSRDYNDFKDIFVAFKCQHNIVYSKITTFSEDSIASQGNIRQLTQDMILNKFTKSPPQREDDKYLGNKVECPSTPESEVKNESSETEVSCVSDENVVGEEDIKLEGSSEDPRNQKEVPKQSHSHSTTSSHLNHSTKLPILLVDEVDVFFGKDFYGQTYNQVTHISTPEVIALIRMIWKDRTSKPSIRTLTGSSEYQTLLANFPEWQYLIDNELKLMCAQVKTFDQPSYVYDAEKDRIGYSEHDTINYTLSFGYRTIFAYLRELDNGNVKATNVATFDQQHLHMQVSCGQFSYASINPSCILGVSGTLSALTTYEEDVMARYRIDQYSLSPSVYGKKDLVFDQADQGIVIADDKADYFKGIVNVINKISRTTDANKKKNRSVIVFFESGARLEEFRTSEYFRQVIENTGVNRLTENTGKDDRDYIIRKAATMGQVTLATKAFGRGTDFISRDTPLNELGGTHVLQTFLSEMLTEEIQIKGRTSRQGQKGSYGMILLLQDDHDIQHDGKSLPKADTLEYFDIFQNDLDNLPRADRYSYLCQQRTLKRNTESVEIEENLKIANERDALTRTYFKSLLSKNYAHACQQFNEIYTLFKGSMTSNCQDGVHVIFMLDESGSMQDDFNELRGAYNNFVQQRREKGSPEDRMSVIMFGHDSRIIAQMVSFVEAPNLSYQGGGTDFASPLRDALSLLNQTDSSHNLMPILLLMTDGGASVEPAASIMKSIDEKYKEDKLQVHFVAFGSGASIQTLECLKANTSDGYIHRSQMGELETTFTSIEKSLMIAEYN